MYMTTSMALGLGAFFAGAAQANTVYNLHASYDANNFFDEFEFFNAPDPTHGFVEYVDGATAMAEGLAGNRDGKIYMGVDTTTQFPPNGRKSVRVHSRERFTQGVFIADFEHVPGAAGGSWPAYWSVDHENWPNNGEIDILEGVNVDVSNSVTLHTSPGCIISNPHTVESTTLVGTDCNAGNAFTGCSQKLAQETQNYGDALNANGGGVYAMEWIDEHISVWFFPRHAIPEDILNGDPIPKNWGPGTAKFYGGDTCDLNSYFKEHSIIFDITFCGDWAGAVWESDPELSALAPTCVDYVTANPQAFAESFWSINYLNVYKRIV